MTVLPRRIGCLGWLVVFGLLAGLALGGGWWWYRSDGDLDALARDPAMPSAPTAVVEATAEQAAALRRLMAAAVPDGSRTPEFWAGVHRDAAVAGGATGGTSTAGVDPRSAAAREAQPWVDGLHFLLCERLGQRPGGGAPPGGIGGDEAAVLVEDGVALISISEMRLGWGMAQQLASALDGRVEMLRGTAAGAAVDGSLRRLRDRLWRARAESAAAAWHERLAALRSRVIDVGILPVVGGTEQRLRLLRLRLLQRVNRAAALRRMAADWRDDLAATVPADLRARSGPPSLATVPWPADEPSQAAAQLLPTVPPRRLAQALELLDLKIAFLEWVPRRAVEPAVPAAPRHAVEPAAVDAPVEAAPGR